MKLSEMSMAQLDAFLVKYVKYVAAIEREKKRRETLAAKENETASGTKTGTGSGSTTTPGLVVSDEDLKAAESAPLTKEDMESVTRILKMSGFESKVGGGGTPGKASYESIVAEIQRTALKLSIKKMYLKGLENDRKAKRCTPDVLERYAELIAALKRGDDKTNPLFPRDAGIELPVGLDHVLNEMGK